MGKQLGVGKRWPAEEAAASCQDGQKMSLVHGWRPVGVLLLVIAVAAALAQPPRSAASGQPGAAASAASAPAQMRQLSALVDELLKFSSEESGLPIKSRVKEQITSRDAVEKYLTKKLQEDKNASRLQRDEIVLKKFGLLDRDFALQPFLLELLKEQIAAYYDSKAKTVYLLDWVDINEQKPVLAHELTHALQDQYVGLEEWNNQTPLDVSLNVRNDRDHLAKDEMDTAREAVIEGQATAVMMDYLLKPMGKSLEKNPEVMDFINQQVMGSVASPVLARAPLLLSESMIFPYREGLNFEQSVWVDQGRAAAFAGTLNRPPVSSWEIIHPREYEAWRTPSVPLLPNIHPLVDKLYKPYDIGQMGQLDLHILTELFGGEQAAESLTSAWDGGIYWAGERRDASKSSSISGKAKSSAGEGGALEKTDAIALFYLSAWKSTDAARQFAQLYAEELGHKYSDVKLDPAAPETPFSGEQQVYSTSEGPVLILVRGKLVFVAESFPLGLARQLASLVLDAQGGGETRTAQNASPELLNLAPENRQPLTGSLRRFYSSCGVMKAVVENAMRTEK